MTSSALLSPADLLLVRLLVDEQKPPTMAILNKDLKALLPAPFAAASLAAIKKELIAENRIEKRSLRLTSAGRTKALELIGNPQLPSGMNWEAIYFNHLNPAALAGVPDRAAELLLIRLTISHGKRPPTLAALRKDLSPLLSSEWNDTLLAVLCYKLRSQGWMDQQSYRPTYRGYEHGLELLKMRDLPVGTTWAKLLMNHLLPTMVKYWIAAESAPPPTPATIHPAPEEEIPSAPGKFDLPAFAQQVLAAARSSPTGWFGDNKVFISHAWRRFHQLSSTPLINFAEFKQHLLEANTSGLLLLSRADLVAAMNETDVQESHIHYLTSDFHFILLDGGHA